jgi:predicted phosphodiesterase
MKLGALGDVHGDIASVRAIMARHPDVEWWVTVGDLADEYGAYEAPPALLHWIKGNNDNLEVIAELGDGRRRIPNLRYLPNGVPVKLGAKGVEQVIEIKLSGEENAALQKSAAAVQELKAVLAKLKY